MPNVLVVPVSGSIFFDRNVAGASTVAALNSAVRLSYDQGGGLNITSYTAATTALDRFTVDGAQGRLFSVADALTGSLMSVNDISGLPILEVLDTDTVIAGAYNTNALVVSGTRVNISSKPFDTSKLGVSGNVSVIGSVSSNAVLYASGGNSIQWNSNYTTTNTNSANWSSAYTSVANNSAKYDSNWTTTNNNSATWSEAYTNLVANSANYLSGASVSFVNANFVKLSGDTMTGGLSTVALSANDIYGAGSQSVFTDGSSLAGNGTGTLTLNYINGIFTTNNVTAALFRDTLGRNSSQWNSNYTSFNSNSAKYDSNWTTTNANSATWSQAYSNLTSNSAAYLSAVDMSLLAATSGSWNSNYTTTKDNSATWGSGGSANTTLNSYSAQWDSNWTTTNNNSANWSSVYTSVANNSAKYDSNWTTTNNNSANWSSVYTSVVNNSAKYDSNWTTTNANSATWSEAYTNLVANSANYLSGASISYVNTNFVKISGDTMTGGLSTVALSANDIYGAGSQSVFTDGSSLAGNGTGTLTLNYANGIFTTNNVTAALFRDTLGRNSNQWSSNYTTTNANSANWSSVYTSVAGNSAKYDSNWTTTNANSANWSSVYTSVANNSAKYDSNWTTTNNNSGSWDSAYATVNGMSANNVSVYTTVSANSARWNDAYAYVSTFPLLTAMRVTGINLGSAAFTSAFTVPAGRSFIATGLTVVFDSGIFTNAIAGTIRLTRNSIVNAANRIMNDLNIGIATYSNNTILRRTSNNDNTNVAQAGETVQIAMNVLTTPYTATVTIEGVLY